jgi:hypothetical protein
MEKNKNYSREKDLKKYQDSDSVSLREMNFGLWLAENRRRITKAIIIFLILLSAGFFLYSSYGYFIYFFGDNSEQLAEEISLLSPRNIVSTLEISPLKILALDSTLDLAVLLKNPNDKFLAKFDYCFLRAETEVNCAAGFILPGEEKYILALGQKIPDTPGEWSFKIKDIFWQRINAHQIPDWNEFLSSRLNFSFADLNFSSGNSSGLSEKVSLNSLEFTVKNLSPYSYYEVPLDIMLYNGSELVGVNRYLLNDFLTGTSRNVKITWPGRLAAVNRTEIKPRINIIEDSVYLKYQGN